MRRNWTREELILAFNIYCKLPFGKYHKSTKEIIELANLINRTPSAIALKLGNFASFDPYHQARGVKGLQNSGKLDKVVFDEFSKNWEDLVFESEVLLAKKRGENINSSTHSSGIITREGKDVIRSTKARINQSFFRSVVLNNYQRKCAVTNIDLPELLIASHIIPWSLNKQERVNPSNGICLSPLYDKLFDRGLMTIHIDYSIIFSNRLKTMTDQEAYQSCIEKYIGTSINLPDKFLPDTKFLAFHRKEVFKE